MTPGGDSGTAGDVGDEGAVGSEGNSNMPVKKVLLIGFGNPGRLDDGLGPRLAEMLEPLNIPGLTIDSDYQLIVEDAAEVAKYDAVIFADAAVAGAEPFWIKRIYPDSAHLSFSSHSVSPQGIVSLAKELFHGEPDAYILGIRGYDFNEFEEKLSPKATENLHAAADYVTNAMQCGFAESFGEVHPEGASLEE